MKKIYLTILMIALTIAFSTAQQPPMVKIYGQVIYQETGLPVKGQSVLISIDSSQNFGHYNKVVTDANGVYTDSVPYMYDHNQAIDVYTNDCRGAMVKRTGYFYPGKLEVVVNLSICSNPATQCEAFFKYSPNPNNALQVAFYDGSFYLPASGKIGYSWNFGDSTSATEQNPVHTYKYPGVYNVCLSISSIDSLCSSTICLPVIVGFPTPGPCESSFSYYLDSVSNQYVFEGLAINQQATEWKWDFGDGTSASGQKVTHIYTNTNRNYTVCLTAIVATANGTVCTSTSCQDLFTYIPSTCESYFWYQPDSVSGADYVFEGYSKNAQISSWTWNFGDGTTATGQKVTHSFANTNANHTVCLTTTGVDVSGDICTKTYCQDLSVNIPSPCESSFAYYADSTGSAYTFEGYAKNSQVNTWLWNFSDGSTATGQKVSHSFSMNPDTAKAPYACLTTTATGADGVTCTFNSCREIYIYIPSPCENDFKAYSEDGLTYSFSGSVASGAPANYYWDFGDGTTANGQLTKHTFKNSGSFFNVCLTTISNDSSVNDTCSSISCQVIYPGGNGSTCQAVMSAIPDSSGNTFYFKNISPVNYSFIYWNFGDGMQSTESNPVHTYSSPGIYYACLTVADSMNDCKNQSCQEIWVNMIQPGCKASFYAFSPDLVPDSFNFMFINTSAEGSYTNQKWSFGDGTGSIDFNPVHAYTAPGIYTVCLTIWDSLGRCQNSYCTDIFAGKITGDNIVSGIVMAGNALADKGIVWLISHDNTYFAEAQIDSAGIYKFNEVPYGPYYIYAMLTPGSTKFFAFMPTYYGNSLSWQGATIINAGEPNAWYPVKLISTMNSSTGDATITGTINWSGNSKVKGIPAAKVEVVLYNNSGNPIAFTFTDSEGTFEFSNLPYGEYTLQAEMPGKATQLIPVSLSASSSAVNIDFRVNESAVYILGIDSQDKTKILAGNPYPNPVLDILTMELNVPVSCTATVEVIDIQGRVIHRVLTELSIGQNRIRIQTGDFKKGIYQLRIKTDGQKPVQRKFVR